MTQDRGTVLVADDDEDVVRFVEVNLGIEGFEVVTASDGEQALDSAFEIRPDLILLGMMMPKIDGFEACQRLRSDTRTQNTPIIMLTAKSLSADKVLSLTAGADDYIIKPSDPIELVARVRSALRRSRSIRGTDPLTQLPGNVQTQDEVTRKVQSGDQFAVMHIDIASFKAFNDYYGFLRGEEAIKLLAGCVSEAVTQHGGEGAFVGHLGGDDFVAIVEAGAAEATARALIESWDRDVLQLYDPADAGNGYIDVVDRRKEMHRYPIATLSIGIATNVHRQITSHWEVAEIAAQMKQFAKRQEGSQYAIDRRTNQEPTAAPAAGAARA